MTIDRTPLYGIPLPRLGTATAAQLAIYNQYMLEAEESIHDAVAAGYQAPLVMPVAMAGGSVDDITAEFTPAIESLTPFLQVRVVASGANTTAVTFTPNSGVVAVKPVIKNFNQALDPGDVPGIMDLVFLSSLDKWMLLNPQNAAEAPAGGEAFKVGDIYTTTSPSDPFGRLGYGTWSLLNRADHSNPLLHFNGVGANFTDSGIAGLTVTPSGAAIQSTAQQKFNQKSLYCPNVGDYITVGEHTTFPLNSDWEFDFWFFPISINNNSLFGWNNTTHLWLYQGYLTATLSETVYQSNWLLTEGVWSHIRIIRYGTLLFFFLNGLLDSTAPHEISTSSNIDNTLKVGFGPSYGMNGYMAEFRGSLIINPIAEFSPPAQPYYPYYRWLRAA